MGERPGVLCSQFCIACIYVCIRSVIFQVYSEKSLPFWEFITKKAKRLLIPYISLGISYTIIKIMFFSISGHPYDIITSFENLIFNPWEFYAVYLWFIYTLFIIFFIVHLTPDRYLPLLGVAAVVCYFLSDRLPSLFCMSSVAQYFIFFISGYCVYRSSANANSLSSVIFGGGGHPLYFILNIYRCIVLLEPLIRCDSVRIHRPTSRRNLFSSSIYPRNRKSFFCGSL
jgi:hypothetical protein